MNEIQIKGRIARLSLAIQNAIHTTILAIDEESDFGITRTEVSAALLKELAANNAYELSELRSLTRGPAKQTT